MKYISTRGKSPAISFEEVATSGLAPDGGLYVPQEFPEFSIKEIKSWQGLSYQELAEKIFIPFMENTIPVNELRKIINASYQTFRNPEIAPIKKLSDKEYILELFHGPTLAFKDFALQFLGNLLDYFLDKRGEDVIIIGATSGDTGSAAIEGCKNCKHIKLFMLHPLNRVSEVQRRQMTTVISSNIFNLAVETDFDGCQAMVKEMFSSPSFTNGKKLVAVNSINWVRIMAQIVYYFYAALKINGAEKPLSFSVPTGNFGDIYAGYVAYKMGLPINKLIVATNRNDILHRFFHNNDYSKKKVEPSLSPSMDIQISSNFERLLFDLYDNDGSEIRGLMENFNKSGVLNASPNVMAKVRKLFDSNSTDDTKTKLSIKQVYEESEYIIDPHTATGVNAARNCSKDYPVVTLATAHPAKFPDVIIDSIGIPPNLPPHLSDIMEREEKFSIIKNDLEKVKEYIKTSV